MKTKAAAIRKLKSWGVKAGMVYQYQKGHWQACSFDSPVGQDLINHNMISRRLGIAPKYWECFTAYAQA